LQPPYSLLARQAEGEILPFAARRNRSFRTTCGLSSSCAKSVFAME
jgi:aryl-alcohol dehydrogenase-like predicted oxidoreductase